MLPTVSLHAGKMQSASKHEDTAESCYYGSAIV